MKIKLSWKVLIFGVILLALVGLYGSITGWFAASPQSSGNYDNFAKCLTEKGAKFYGSYQCGHCRAQKELFGSSIKYIDYIECGPLSGPWAKECIDADVTSVPLWIIDGMRYLGTQSLEELSRITRCSLTS